MDPLELERRADRRLKALPQPLAPVTLLPRVMAAARVAAARQARAWFAWSPGWQVASLAALVAAVGGIVFVWPAVVVALTGPVADVLSPVASLAGAVRLVGDALLGAAGVVDRTVLQPAAFLVAALMVLMVGACAVFGSALGHVLAGGASHS